MIATQRQHRPHTFSFLRDILVVASSAKDVIFFQTSTWKHKHLLSSCVTHIGRTFQDSIESRNETNDIRTSCEHITIIEGKVEGFSGLLSSLSILLCHHLLEDNKDRNLCFLYSEINYLVDDLLCCDV